MSPKDLADFVNDVGLPTVLLLAAVWGAFRAARWLGPKAITPVVDAVVGCFDALRRHAEQSAAVLTEVRQAQRETDKLVATACRWQPCVHCTSTEHRP